MVTYIIIGITALISISAFSNRTLFDKLLFDPFRINHRRQFYRFFTHGLIHADWMHLGVNMFVFLSFGRMVEDVFKYFFGTAKGMYFFALLYIGGILLSSLPSYGKHKDNPMYTAVGASGAVSAIVFSSIIISPLSGIRFIFIPFDIPAFVFGLLYLVYSAYMSRKGNDNIGHDAHFWGALFGIAFTLIIKPALLAGFIDQINTFIMPR
ncbi:MAG TPA: rhomboid family intramembrane serine protease [Lentimicrobium sp.]|nr:rhomboid family intramembrane serine protease [Lentimicrobium sp.]